MAEPQANGPRDNPAPERSPNASAPDRGPDPAPPPNPADALLHPPPPSDDTPTVVSRKIHAPPANNDALAAALRGRRLAHYELLAPIGVGGMAAVIRARDTQLDRTVALKILPPEMASDPENVRRFHQEARAAAKLDHENIARAFFCGEDQGLHFIAFEFVEGENLRHVLERRGRLPVAEALHYLLQVATGLAHAAARGVVHRDIKPSNILITPNGRAKLVDMGLARSLHHDQGLTQSGVTLGTFDYISPEQAMEPRDADSRSDIYSLGCTAYHMLTGQPPVPEGTAARKLHHHQHVDPLDPRTLNPHIPDEVAALLARMMAKDPKERYQRPDELVQHLLYLAQKYGASTQRGDGVLFVEAPLPAPPRTRPLVLAGVGVAVLLIVVAVFGPAGGPERRGQGSGVGGQESGVRSQGSGVNGEGQEPKGSGQGATAQAAEVKKAEPKAAPVVYTVRSARELAELLEKQPSAVVRLTDDLDLTSRDDTLTVAGEVTLEAAPGKRPVVRLTYDASAGSEPWAVFTVKAGHLKVSGLRFEVDATEAPDLVMSALALNAGRLTVENCEFVQLRPAGGGPGSLSALAIASALLADLGPRVADLGGRNAKSRLPREPAGAERPTAIVRQCVFAGGQRAVTVTTPANVSFTDCAFGPHSAAVCHLQGNGATDLHLHRCSLLLGDGAVFRLQDGAGGLLDVHESLFGGPRAPAMMPNEMDPTADLQGVLVQQAGTPTGAVRFVGQNNAYYHLKAYWQQPPGQELTRYADFRRRALVSDERSHELTASPWQEADPLAALRRGEYRSAFQVSPTQRELRLADPARAVGMRAGPGWEYDPLPRPDERKPAEAVARKDKVVDTSVTESGEGVYPTLAQAVGEAKPGDVILIKHNGRLPVEPVRLEKANLDLTIKPHPEFRPVLTLGPTTEPDAALFRLHDGKLRLEGLQFAFPPPRDDFRTQTVVAVLGDGQCTLKDCAVTLEETRTVQMAVVTLPDASAVMRTGGTPRVQGPVVRLEGCFVRGSGDLLAVRPSRPFELQVEESLLSLEGSLLVVDGSPREAPAAPPSQVQLRKVTAYLTDHLVWLRAAQEGRTGRGLAQTQVQAANCLFAAAGGKSLVHLDGVDTDEQMKRVFVWAGGQNNVYSNFPQLLDQQPREPEMMSVPAYDKTRWEGFTREADGRFERVRFAAPPAEGQHAKATPADFKVKAEADLQGTGADLDRLPRPADETAQEE
jgi:Protein kinase domain